MDRGASAKRRRAELCRLPRPARRDALLDCLRVLLAEALKTVPDEIRVDAVVPDPKPILWMLEVPVQREIGFVLRSSDLPHCTSLRGLADYLADELMPPSAPSAPMGDLYEGASWAWGPVAGHVGPPLDQPITFVLSAPRSGSTLLRAMLARHPRLYAPSELCLLPFESMGARGRLLDTLGYPWMRLGLLSAMTELTGLTWQQAAQEHGALERGDLAIAAVYQRLHDLASGRTLVDKSPIYAAHPDWLARAERVFRAPRYIHLTRHPGAVIESFVRMRFHLLSRRHWLIWDENSWLRGEKTWAAANLHISSFLRQVPPERQLRVSYEELVTDPAVVTARICAFLEVPFDPSVLDPYAPGRPVAAAGGREAGDPGFLGHTRIEAGLATDWVRDGPPQPLGRITREICEALGYAVA